MRTELRLNADVICTDGPAGRLTDIVLDPTTALISHVVVEAPGLAHLRHLVPVALVESGGGGEVQLSCSRQELAYTDFFTEMEQVPEDGSNPWTWSMAADDMLPWPLAPRIIGPLLVEHERVPPGELALDHDTPVQATDGPVGYLEALVLHSNDEHLADVIVRRGHLWRRREVVVPAAAIERIDPAAVHLKLSKARLRTLPTSVPGRAA